MKNNKIKDEVKLLSLFTNHDDARPYLHAPFFNPDYNEVWATDGCVLMRISPDRLNENYEPVGKRLKLPKVSNPCQLSCTLDAIKQALDACPMVDEVTREEYEEKCEECDGTGDVEWKYADEYFNTHSHYFDCPKCGGDGVVRRLKKKSAPARKSTTKNPS